MHVVEVRHAHHPGQHHADEARFLVRVDDVVAASEHAPDGGERQGDVERDLRERRADADPVQERRTEAAEDAQPRQADVAAERIGDQVDGVAQVGERADAVVLAERGAPGLEERLRRQHEDLHRFEHGIVGKHDRKVNVSLAICGG